MEVALILKVLDIVSALITSGFSFDEAYTRVSNFIKAQTGGITVAQLDEIFDSTDARIKEARKLFKDALADPDTPAP